ncbi:hypothetical protein [Brevibacillus reuszeri]|uniref:hypothetical protein n=1 Tax=Brevibacillus reuszeri TaxID=54915 RepID=UPI003D24E0ED
MQWYHGTSHEKWKSILEIGFIPEEGLFGKGVYFSSSKDGAGIFGTHIIRIKVDDTKIDYLRYEDFREEFDENETSLQCIYGVECPALAIKYVSGECELVIYDTSVITEIT